MFLDIEHRCCLCLVSPERYQKNFNIDSSSGVVSMVTAIDREEMTSSSISVSIKVFSARYLMLAVPEAHAPLQHLHGISAHTSSGM